MIRTMTAALVAATMLTPPAPAAQAAPPGAPQTMRRMVPAPGAPQMPADPQASPQGGPQLVRRMAPPPPPRTGDRADLAIELVAGMPTIPVMINGKGPYRLGVETGYPGFLRITPAVAAALALQQVGEARGSDPSGRNPRTIPIYALDRVTVGGLTYTGVQVGAAEMGSERMKTVDGLIGLAAFDKLLVTIDYGAGKFTARSGALPAPDGKTVVPATIEERGLVAIPLSIGGKSYPVHLDTGNSRYSLFMPADLIPTLPTRGTARDVGVARTVSQEVKLQAIDLTAPVSIGTTRLNVTDVGFPAIAQVGNIGSLGLAGMAVTLDLANRRVSVVPSKAAK